MVNSIATSIHLKRSAKIYVSDYKNLKSEELKKALVKLAPQYYHKANVVKALEFCKRHENRDVRILYRIILKNILLNKDGFISEQRVLNEDIIKYEQEMINTANKYVIHNQNNKKEKLELFSFILETAWDNDDYISPDEKNLILKIKKRLAITDKEYSIIEAKLGMFPKRGNIIHSNDEINAVKKELNYLGLMFLVRDDNEDYDIIPEETAKVLREIFNVEIKMSGYRKLIKNRNVKNKDYLINILNKGKVEFNKYLNLKELQKLTLEHIKPSVLLGGYSSKDGVNVEELIKWCKELKIPSSGQKTELINRILKYYDEVRAMVQVAEDERVKYFEYFEDLANRNLINLRKQNVISKDIECERKFEKATNYLFENLLNQQPVQLVGTEHPDGILSYKNRLIQWDNKSKETPVNLADHIKQFTRYINSSKKEVSVFIVLAPHFTKDSIKVAMDFQLLNDTVITLVKASDLKEVALKWNKLKKGEPFPLGYFKQPGLFKKENISYK